MKKSQSSHRYVIDFNKVKKKFILLDLITNKSKGEFNSMAEAAASYREFVTQNTV